MEITHKEAGKPLSLTPDALLKLVWHGEYMRGKQANSPRVVVEGVNDPLHVLEHGFLVLQKAVSTVAAVFLADAGPASRWVESDADLTAMHSPFRFSDLHCVP